MVEEPGENPKVPRGDRLADELNLFGDVVKQSRREGIDRSPITRKRGQELSNEGAERRGDDRFGNRPIGLIIEYLRLVERGDDTAVEDEMQQAV